MGKETAVFVTTCQVKSQLGTPHIDVLNISTNRYFYCLIFLIVRDFFPLMSDINVSFYAVISRYCSLLCHFQPLSITRQGFLLLNYLQTFMSLSQSPFDSFSPGCAYQSAVLSAKCKSVYNEICYLSSIICLCTKMIQNLHVKSLSPTSPTARAANSVWDSKVKLHSFCFIHHPSNKSSTVKPSCNSADDACNKIYTSSQHHWLKSHNRRETRCHSSACG